MKKIALVLLFAFVLMTTPVLAGPFADVPSNHWAYNSIVELTRVGVLEGYPDTKFKGNQAITRYEAAAMVARAIDKGFNHSLLQKLTIEFADELALLGVKVTALEDEVRAMRGDVEVIKSDVEMLKSGYFGKIRVTGEARIRYQHNMNDFTAVPNNNNMQTRFRLNYDIAIDENVTAYVTADVDRNFWGTAVNNMDEGINMFHAFIDVKDFGGVADMRIGRQPFILGKGIILDNSVDALLFSKMYHNSLFTVGAMDIPTHLGNLTTPGLAGGLPIAVGGNDSLETKILTFNRMFDQRWTLGFYVLGIDLAENLAVTGVDDLHLYGLHIDGRLWRDVLGFLEFASWNRDDVAGAITDYNLYKLGLEWTINDKYDLTVLYGHRDRNAPIISVHDDYTDSIYWRSNQGLTNAESYLNSDYWGVIFGAKLARRVQLDLWYENLEGDDVLGGVGTNLRGVYDQDAFQLVATHQYRDNTSFKLRYRNVSYDKNDADYVALGLAAGNALDYEEVRMDMTIRF